MTEDVTIDNGIGIPVINDRFPDHAGLSSAFIVSTNTGAGIHSTTFCSQSNPLKPAQDPLTSELLVFHKGAYSNHLVNLHTSDIKHMKDVIKWYASRLLSFLHHT